MTNLPEQWRPILGYEGLYEASSHGRIRSLPRVAKSGNGYRAVPGRVLSVPPEKDYPVVTLSKAGRVSSFRVHVLVAVAFLGDHRRDKVVNHIDGDKSNNHLSNLEWVTFSDNTTFSVLEKTLDRPELPPRAPRTGRLTAEEVRAIRRLAVRYRHKTLAAHFGVHYNTITGIVHGRTYRHLLPTEERGTAS